MGNNLHFVLGIFGNVFGIALFVVPLITFISVVKKGSTEEYSGIPYVAALFNCLVYTWYGLPLVTSDNILVSSVNGCGVVLEIFYICLYLTYAPPKYTVKILRLFIGVLALFAAIVAVSVLAFHGTGRELFVGIIGVAVSVAMFAAPLSIMKLVVQTRSVEFMPFFLSVSVFLCGFTWFFYGILGRDIFVALPNGLGALLGAAQILLYCVYRNSSRNNEDYERSLLQ
ncbi:hypothetical protein SUGI_1197550 [Cryptomeria japonica]|nr:hypothetical protein SUGI_1197550 [Cryptomeria japonica]